MKNIVFTILGIIFGIVLTKSEAISWFRIHEMFRFESFHMYGIIGVAAGLGIIVIQGMKKAGIKTIDGHPVDIVSIPFNIKRHLIAGTIFGLGWGLASCPGPTYVLLGHGFWIYIIVLIGALLGTLLYASVKEKLPH